MSKSLFTPEILILLDTRERELDSDSGFEVADAEGLSSAIEAMKGGSKKRKPGEAA